MPAHALLVHGAVVFGPVAGLLAVAYAVPALRERLRGVTLVTAVLAAVFVVLAYPGRAARVLPLLAAVGGVATVVAVVLTGDAGARAVWGG